MYVYGVHVAYFQGKLRQGKGIFRPTFVCVLLGAAFSTSFINDNYN